MNIMRYKWSAIVAAGLHGALFINVPHPRIVAEPTPIAEPLPAIPTDLIRVEEPDPAETTETVPAASRPSRAEAPEPPPAPTADRQLFTTPIHEPTKLRPIDSHQILCRDGIEGTANGVGVVPTGISATKDLDRVPRATAQVSPDYPSALRQSGQTGSVLVEFDVDTSGRVVRAEAVRFSRREFVEPAVRAVLRWHFEPGKRHGKVVPFRMAVPIEFSGVEN